MGSRSRELAALKKQREKLERSNALDEELRIEKSKLRAARSPKTARFFKGAGRFARGAGKAFVGVLDDATKPRPHKKGKKKRRSSGSDDAFGQLPPLF